MKIEFRDPDYGKGKRYAVYFDNKFIGYVDIKTKLIIERQIKQILYAHFPHKDIES